MFQKLSILFSNMGRSITSPGRIIYFSLIRSDFGSTSDRYGSHHKSLSVQYIGRYRKEQGTPEAHFPQTSLPSLFGLLSSMPLV
jgi:hypothetical protein